MGEAREKHLDAVEAILVEIAEAIVAPRSMKRSALDDLAWFRRVRKEAAAALDLRDALRSMLAGDPDAPHKARAAMARAALADNAFRRTIADKPR